MTLPDNAECIRVLALLCFEPTLSNWEREFIRNNLDRTEFTTLQKESVKKLKEKYECG